MHVSFMFFFFFSSRRRHTRWNCDWSSDVCSSDLKQLRGKKVAVSRFGSGSHFQTNLALRDGGIDPDKDVTILQIGNSGARIEIGRAHVCTPVTVPSRMPSSA